MQGLKNSPILFDKALNVQICWNLDKKYLQSTLPEYANDLLIASVTEDGHGQEPQGLLETLQALGCNLSHASLR